MEQRHDPSLFADDDVRVAEVRDVAGGDLGADAALVLTPHFYRGRMSEEALRRHPPLTRNFLRHLARDMRTVEEEKLAAARSLKFFNEFSDDEVEEEDADPCFARVVSGFDAVDRMHAMPTKGEGDGWKQSAFRDDVIIRHAKILPRM